MLKITLGDRGVSPSSQRHKEKKTWGVEGGEERLVGLKEFPVSQSTGLMSLFSRR